MWNKHVWMRHMFLAAGALILAFAASSAADILDDWSAVKPPPPPELKQVTLDPSTTALLILDMMKANCGARPRCVATVPNVKRLQDEARKAGMMIWYSLVGSNGQATPADVIDQTFAPREGEWARTGGPDKFIGSNLEEKLKARGVKTVIVCGTSFQGVGIGTAGGAVQRGYKAIVPIDCLSSEDTYMEQSTAWHLYKGGPAVVTAGVTVTRSTMMKF